MADLDTLNKSLRQFIREALGMPDNSVRPANQSAPAGSKTEEFATVLLTLINEEGWDDHRFADDVAPALTVTETVKGQRRVTASIQFFRGDAYGRACRLRTLLTLGNNSDKLQALGLGFVRASAARNLTAVVDTYWESRGQIDLEFYVVVAESASVATYGTFLMEVMTEHSTSSFEVTKP